MHLATTRLSEFWPAGRPLTLLGKWCLSEKDLWRAHPFTILPYPWDDRARFDAAAAYVADVYERLLLQLRQGLCELHGMDRSLSYWRIIVGPWLAWYLEAFYDRYVCLADARGADADLCTIGLAHESYIVPADFLDFVALYLDDRYNLQLYTQILESWKLELPRKRSERSVGQVERADGLDRLRKAATGRVRRILRGAQEAVVRRSPIALVGTGLPRRERLAMWMRSGFRIAACHAFDDRPACSGVTDPTVREQLGRWFKPLDEFETVAAGSIAANIPTAYLEDFSARRSSAAGSRIPSVLLSDYGWCANEAFKIFAAEAQHAGCRILAGQHGGYYGILQSMSPEIHEQRISDRFYSWGWTKGLASEASVQPMPSLHLVRCGAVRARRRDAVPRQSIVLIATAHPRYLYRFQSHPVGPQWQDYFLWQLRFAEHLADVVRRRLIVKLYVSSYGWDIGSPWRERFPGVRLDSTTSVWEHLASAALVVIDHPGTTVLEAFAADVPTLLFWDHERFALRPGVETWFEELRQAFLLHDTPESAADTVNMICADPGSWWTRTAVRTVRERFCGRFARTSERWLTEWTDELLEQAAPRGRAG